MFLRFRDTLRQGGHIHSIQITKTNIQQGVCCYAGRRIYSQLHIAINPFPADGFLSAFVVIFIISFLISSGSGLDIIKYQHSSKLWPLQQLLGPAVVIDESRKAAGQPDYQVTVADVEAWEKQHGKLADNVILLFNTGWHQFYPDAGKYLGTSEKGQEAVSKLHFPSIHPDLARWLVKNRKIKAVGIDTASVDY